MHTRRAVKMTENEQIQIYEAVKFITIIFGLYMLIRQLGLSQYLTLKYQRISTETLDE